MIRKVDEISDNNVKPEAQSILKPDKQSIIKPDAQSTEIVNPKP